MAFNNVPLNGWPQIKDLERLDALAKQIEDMPVYTSDDRAFLDKWERDLPILEEGVSDLETYKANQITIAPTFSAETAYEVGDLVYYNGLSYRCTNSHEGEWDADDFAATTINNELSALNSKLTTVTTVIKGGIYFIKCGRVAMISKIDGTVTTDEEGYIQDDGEDLTVPNGFMPMSTVNFLETYAGERISLSATNGKFTMANVISETGVIVRFTAVYIVNE